MPVCPRSLLTVLNLAFMVLPLHAYDDMALVKYMTKIGEYRLKGESYENIRKKLKIDSPEEFRSKNPDNFPLAYNDENPEIPKPTPQPTKYPSLAEIHDLMLKRFAVDFHKLLHLRFEHQNAGVNYHTLEIIKAVLNLPAFEDIDIKPEREA